MLLFQDGFELYGAISEATDSGRWDYRAPFDLSLQTTAGRFGGRCFRYFANNDGAAFGKVIDDQTEMFASVAVLYSALSGTPVTTAAIMSFQPVLEDSSMVAAGHVNIMLRAGGKIAANRNTTQLEESAAQVIFSNTYHRIEAYVLLHDTTGRVIVKVDEVTVIDFTGDTIHDAFADPVIRGVMFGRYANAQVGSNNYDDVAFWNASGDQPNTSLGDFVIDTLNPNANGSVAFGTAVGAASLYQCVDEPNGHNSDTDYVKNTTVGNIAMFALPDLVAGGDIIAVGVVAKMRADAPGAHSASLGVRVESTNFFEAAPQSIPAQATYVNRQTVFGENPATAVAWTVGDIDALQIGYRIDS